MGDRCTVARDPGGEGVPEMAHSQAILDELAHDLLAAGLVDERLDAAKLIYLAVTSRLHDRPVSVVVKGNSSSGKSWLVGTVLAFHPNRAVYVLSAMSERALAYSTADLRHRMLVIYEAAGLGGEFASYLLRSLLSEGRIRYETVQSGSDGLQPKVIEREGPTGLLSTTTAIMLHSENETRLLSTTVADTYESQQAVFAQWGEAAAGSERVKVDYGRWHALVDWLETGEREVIIPYAPRLAALLPPHAPRLQRDFIAVLALIQASALLHRATRDRDDRGRIVATLADYAEVRKLVEPIIAAGVEAAVKPETRATVQAVAELLPDHPDGIDLTVLTERLKLDKGSVSRRVRDARKVGYLMNMETMNGRPARIVLGKPMPTDTTVLPVLEVLR